ncbi:MAG: hypothetical protein COB50_00535, partial [Thiotrichales bacterium]
MKFFVLWMVLIFGLQATISNAEIRIADLQDFNFGFRSVNNNRIVMVKKICIVNPDDNKYDVIVSGRNNSNGKFYMRGLGGARSTIRYKVKWHEVSINPNIPTRFVEASSSYPCTNKIKVKIVII